MTESTSGWGRVSLNQDVGLTIRERLRHIDTVLPEFYVVARQTAEGVHWQKLPLSHEYISQELNYIRIGYPKY